MQNFFTKGTNHRRVNPAQVSGKELFSEFRMRNNGSSVQIVSVKGVETDVKNEIAAHVVVCNPDGDVVFEDTFLCTK